MLFGLDAIQMIQWVI